MNRLFKWVMPTAVAVVLAGLFGFIRPTHAATATLVSMSPTAIDISDSLTGMPEWVEGFLFIPTITTEGTTYTGVFSVSEAPLAVMTVGGKIVDTWTYDLSTGQVTVPMTYTGQIMSPDGEMVDAFSVAIAFAGGESGPPAEAEGVWMSTNLLEWTMIPPSEEDPHFGFELSGQEGFNGYFQMFLPDTLIDLIGELQGKEISVDDLAVFVDDSQASLSVSEVTGGALIDINVTFKSGNTQTTSAATEMITKEVSTGSKLPISLAAKKNPVSDGNTARLYGWLKNGQAGETVTIWRKRASDDKFVKVATVTTKADGYYSYAFTAKKTANWKTKWKKNADVTKVSPKVTLTVNE